MGRRQESCGSRTVSVLLVNTGSSSLKFSVLVADDCTLLASGLVDWAGNTTNYQFATPARKVDQAVDWKGPAQSLRRVVGDLRLTVPRLFTGPDSFSAVGHRVVHGGEFDRAMRITPDVRSKLAELSGLAPLHNPPSLEAIDAAMAEFPDLPHIACFDTAFHRTMLPAAQAYAIPNEWAEQWRIRRYGFHGLSHAYCAERAAEMLGYPKRSLRLVICHLGHGCSASAVRDGKCVDTTMGFTPLEGLMMATRSGSFDPEVILHLQQQCGLSIDAIRDGLNRRSGLLGVSGVSADMRAVMASAASGNERARMAIAMYCQRVRQAIGALAVTLGGVDALVFTAGVGENSAQVREEICNGLECLGLHLDSINNLHGEPDTDVAAAKSPGRILVIKSREDLSMLQQTMQLVESPGCAPETS
jgi:acetate kinase